MKNCMNVAAGVFGVMVPMDAPGDGWYHIESNEEHPAKREGGDIV